MDGYIAQIMMFGSNFAPRNWALCQGQLLSISQNTALFALIGTYYGGNGQTTFALPDLRSRTPIGVGTGAGLQNVSIGETLGSETTVLTVNNLPAHQHAVTVNVGVSANNPTTDAPLDGILAAGNDDEYASVASANGNMGGTSLVISPTGGGQPISRVQPYLGINFIICLFGIFPSRN